MTLWNDLVLYIWKAVDNLQFHSYKTKQIRCMAMQLLPVSVNANMINSIDTSVNIWSHRDVYSTNSGLVSWPATVSNLLWNVNLKWKIAGKEYQNITILLVQCLKCYLTKYRWCLGNEYYAMYSTTSSRLMNIYIPITKGVRNQDWSMGYLICRFASAQGETIIINMSVAFQFYAKYEINV